MKLLTQVVLPILLLVGLIGGVTFVSHYSGSRKKSETTTRATTEVAFDFDPALVDGKSTVQWDEQQPNRMAEFEIFTPHHYDFGFHNRGQVPLTVGLKRKNCNCATVRMTLLDEAEAKAIADEGMSAAKRWEMALEADGRWQGLDETSNKPVTVPPGGRGLIRVRWEGNKLGEQGLQALLWIDQGDRGRTQASLRVPLNIVPAIRVLPMPVVVPDLTGRGQEQKVDFVCWSSTRDQFPLKVQEESRGPCFVCEAKPLDAKQCQQWGKAQNSRVLSGYRVTVTVRERSEKQQLDLGPFRRRVTLLAGIGPSESATVLLEGMVRGEVTFLNPDDKDRVDLGPFRADRGTSKTVVLATEQDGLKLEVDSWTPPVLEVKLTPAGERRWNLTVTAPAKGLTGRLPDDSAVIVRTPTRRMRIPIVGQATREASQAR